MTALPVYQWHLAPTGLATRRQLRAMNLRPGGQDVVAELQRPAASAGRWSRTCTASTAPSRSGR